MNRTLQKLFLKLFLRGRSSRGLRKGGAPRSVASKLALSLLFYALIGMVAFSFIRQPIFALSLYLHAMTLVFLGMFVASSAGEVLFNKEEGDILLHRPVTPRALLWAKISVLIRIALWLSCAFNITGFIIGAYAQDSSWLYVPVHALSASLEALFCTSCVVLTYQLCLRWFGRERLDALMTTVQVFVAILTVLGGQLVPQLMANFGNRLRFAPHAWWVGLLPPAWFAGIDDAIAGTGATNSWVLGAIGVIVTAVLLWLAFVKLAQNYQRGLQTISEAVPVVSEKRRPRRRWLAALCQKPPLSWWLRDSVSRASFMLTVAYISRDRETKLRIFPGIAPMLVMPIIFLIKDPARAAGPGGFGIAFTGGYLGLIPLLALNLLRFSQQWQASDLFRVAPIAGPAPLVDGARRAVLLFLTFPLLIIFGLLAWSVSAHPSNLLLVLPGLLALPIYSLIPCMGGKALPLSTPAEEGKSAGRALSMIGVMLVSMALSGLALFAWAKGMFWWMILFEAIVVIVLYVILRSILSLTRWPSLD